MSEFGLMQETWSERTAHAHASESAHGWQYGVVWRFAEPDVDYPTLGPPAGDGWELNADFAGGFIEARLPRWANGDVVMQLTHWRREAPGMPWGDPKKQVSERVKWDGDPRP
jgi:hypothetical protein